MNRPNNSLAVIAIVLSGVAWSCNDSKTSATRGTVAAAGSESAAPRGPVQVEVFEVIPDTAPAEQLVPAVLSVEGTALVLAQRDGTLVQLDGEEGKRVTRAQLIARLTSEDLGAALRQAELEVERLEVEEKQYEAMIQVNRSELDQETALFKDGLTSKRQLDRARFKLEVATQELERTRLATRSARVKVEAAKIEIDKSMVRAPIDGIITRRSVRLGASVVKNDKMFEISKLGPLEVRFQLPQAGKGLLDVGRLVNLSLAERDQTIARARIRRIDPVADAASNTVGYLADVIGGAALIPGLAVTVHVPGASAASVAWVPRTAFEKDADLRVASMSTLFVAAGDRCELRLVRVNAVDGDRVEIGSGLNAGDRVIVDPPARLKPGAAIEVRR